MLDAIEETGQLDNTLVFYIAGDNGTSGEGGLNGMFNEMTYFNGVQENVDGHAQASSTSGAGPRPTRTWRRAGRWPSTRRSPGRSRSPRTSAARATAWSSTGPRASRRRTRFAPSSHHVIDVAPTILEAAGLPEPKMVNGTPQIPMEGVSMVYTFDDAQGQGAPHHAVLRDVRQPRDLPRRLVRPHDPQGAVGAEAAPDAADNDVWELYDVAHRLQPGQRPGREEPEEARRRCRRCS